MKYIWSFNQQLGQNQIQNKDGWLDLDEEQIGMLWGLLEEFQDIFT